MTTILFSLLFGACKASEGPTKPLVEEGILHLEDWDFSKNGNVNLEGSWRFYWSKFLSENSESDSDPQPDAFVKIPDTWNGLKIANQELSGIGYATYSATIFVNPNVESLALKVLDLSTSFRLYWNGELIFTNGIASDKKETSKPAFLPGIVYLKKIQERNELVVEVSNYFHPRGGFWESIRIGLDRQIAGYREQKLGFDLFLCGSLLIMGIYHLGLFSLRRKDLSSLLLGIFCFIIFLRILLTGERLLFTTYPNLDWGLLVKLEYLTFYLATPVFSMFIYSLFPEEFQRKITILIVCIGAVFTAIVIFFNPFVYARTAIPFQVFTIISCAYALFALTLSSVRSRDGAKIALLGFVIFFLTIVNDILYGNFVINTAYLAPFGLFSFIFSQAFLLSLRFSRAFKNVEELSENLSKTNSAYSRFVPKEFLRFLGKSSIMQVELGDQIQKDMTVLFSDISSFTELSEQMNPKENFDFLNSYLKIMSPLIRKHKGVIDKYIGDGIMALFPESPDDAIQASIAMLQVLDGFNQDRALKGRSPISIRIGMHLGSLMLGTIGESERMDSSVISDAVNLASRMEGLNKYYGSSIVISESVLFHLQDPNIYSHRFLGKVRVKGKQEPVSVFEIFDGDSFEILSLKKKIRPSFEQGLHFYYDKKLRMAQAKFQEVLEVFPDDPATLFYIARIEYFRKRSKTVLTGD